jgi:predicted DNA-binding protein
MATTKVTFTLDEATIHRIEEAAERLGKPKSQIIREAVSAYYERIGRLSERERLEMLRVFDTLIPRIPSRGPGAAQREIRAIRQARRLGGRRSGSRDRK